eukprot:5865793-Karenia_brevis.AAC.1
MVDPVERLLPIQSGKVQRFSRRFSRVRKSSNNISCWGGAALSPKSIVGLPVYKGPPPWQFLLG